MRENLGSSLQQLFLSLLYIAELCSGHISAARGFRQIVQESWDMARVKSEYSCASKTPPPPTATAAKNTGGPQRLQTTSCLKVLKTTWKSYPTLGDLILLSVFQKKW